jgi:hypothetical protein
MSTTLNSKTKTSKKIIEEPESCSVCMDNYTSIIRKKCICKYCNSATCSKCIERYLLERHEDAHCLHCRVNYNDSALLEICTKTYLQHTYFKHRQDVLVNRERSNLPGLQDVAIEERNKRAGDVKIAEINKEIKSIDQDIRNILENHNALYTIYFQKLTVKENVSDIRKSLDALLSDVDKLRADIRFKRDIIDRIRFPTYYTGGAPKPKPEEEERKKFIRRCARDGCQGFLSTAWKCGICEYYTCNKCFVPKTKKHDDPHECKKEDVETADLIKKDSKPCPNCGEFIMKSSGCSQMWCISCQTPWDWNTGKIVTNGIIHNPHYYEWTKRNGGVPRNPADVPCGGYPAGWDLVRMPRGTSTKISTKFFEFHRICQEIQDISTRTYRSHIDNTLSTNINVKFLLGDFDEKHWGQLLAKNEKKRKRDNEVQEIFAAFRMVAVELINRIQQYSDNNIRNFTLLPVPQAEEYIIKWNEEVIALIKMINDALRNVSISYNYSVPYIAIDENYYSIKTKNFSGEVKKKRIAKLTKEEEEDDEDEDDTPEPLVNQIIVPPTIETPSTNISVVKKKKPIVAKDIDSKVANSLTENTAI